MKHVHKLARRITDVLGSTRHHAASVLRYHATRTDATPPAHTHIWQRSHNLQRLLEFRAQDVVAGRISTTRRCSTGVVIGAGRGLWGLRMAGRRRRGRRRSRWPGPNGGSRRQATSHSNGGGWIHIQERGDASALTHLVLHDGWRYTKRYHIEVLLVPVCGQVAAAAGTTQRVSKHPRRVCSQTELGARTMGAVTRAHATPRQLRLATQPAWSVTNGQPWDSASQRPAWCVASGHTREETVPAALPHTKLHVPFAPESQPGQCPPLACEGS